MIRIDIGAVYNNNDYDELARMFLPRSKYEFIFQRAEVFEGVAVKLEKARELYLTLSSHTGIKLPWGILTGVKPGKLFARLAEDAGSMAARLALEREYFVSPEKTELLRRIYLLEREILPVLRYDCDCDCHDTLSREKTQKPVLPAGGAVSVYIGIPFCPTRCAYCTFTAVVGTEKQMARYLEALYKELSYTAHAMRLRGMKAESLYIGGGTPTALTPSMLEELLTRVNEEIVPKGAEFTVEAGRPDTITYEKARIIADARVGRVSVNPQTMNEVTLARIGRVHSVADVHAAFEHVRAAGIPLVNADLIAGLPGEDCDDFRNTLDEILKLRPENVTVHTLALKKGSPLRERNPEYGYTGGTIVYGMLCMTDEYLTDAGFAPYYLYRQKQTKGSLENTGYAMAGTECLYNMRMMQEKQTVIALGAGAVSKLYFPEEDRIERIFNMADMGLYIERLQEMKERKKRLFELPL